MLIFPVSYAHNTFAFNAQYDAAGAPVIANTQNTVAIDRRRIESMFREGRDAYQLASGGALGRAHKGFKVVRLWGRIVVPVATIDASLGDKERAMLAAFDPELCYQDSPTTDGAYALDWTELTTDTTNYGTGGPGGMGRIPQRLWVRPAAAPTIEEVVGNPSVLSYALVLVAPDPRTYEQAESTLVLSPGTPSGNVINRGTVPAPLKATIVTSASGSATFTITRGGVSFIVNLSAVGAATTIVVMETCAPYGRGRYITKGGVESASLQASGPGTWLNAPVGTTNFTISNTTNITSCTLGWWNARA